MNTKDTNENREPDWQISMRHQLMMSGLDASFKARIDQLFSTLVTSLITSKDTERNLALGRFEKGLGLIEEAYDMARTVIKERSGVNET
jgi:hypothetical protein